MILTTQEYNAQKNKLILAYADFWYKDMQKSKWALGNKLDKCSGKLLWLFVYVLEMYTHTTAAQEDNYLTEKEVMAIFAKTNTLS